MEATARSLIVGPRSERHPRGGYGKLRRAMQMTARVTEEGDLYVTQCLDANVANQGAVVDEGLANLREAFELRFEDEDVPADLQAVVIRPIEVNLRGAS